MNRSQRRHLFIAGLVYPAFLGNMTYVAAEKLFREQEYFTLLTTSLVLALLLHYVMDWLHTSSAKATDYLPAQLLWDFLIVVCLYVAMRLALNEQGQLTQRFWPFLREPASWLAITKVLAVFWEAVSASTYNPKNWFHRTHAALIIDLAFFGVYLALATVATQGWATTPCISAALALAVFLDAVAYYLYTRVRQRK
jgi:hypothetical protein